MQTITLASSNSAKKSSSSDTDVGQVSYYQITFCLCQPASHCCSLWELSSTWQCYCNHAHTLAQPPSGSYPTHVDGSNLHTLSHVHLGASPLQPIHNSTKTDSYPPISAPILRVRAPERDNIPLNYYPGEGWVSAVIRQTLLWVYNSAQHWAILALFLCLSVQLCH